MEWIEDKYRKGYCWDYRKNNGKDNGENNDIYGYWVMATGGEILGCEGMCYEGLTCATIEEAKAWVEAMYVLQTNR